MPSRPDGSRVYSSSGIAYYVPRNRHAFRRKLAAGQPLARERTSEGAREEQQIESRGRERFGEAWQRFKQ
ncbi:hypothetical protein WN48_10787 [Eufriesea mexicana]|uniref:Uncharacterized protein n=1 Tax=Eufriesea mexicana TaxID=516756 RepID=A0A310SD94_9HYME|nr:hypothetical protein WN48_10787 [Eufriesea mexicana]